MMRNWSYLLAVLLFFGCSQKKEDAAEHEEQASLPAPDWSIRKAQNEERLLVRLAGNMSADPVGSVEEGKNAAVEFVLDKGWDVRTTRTGLLYQVVEEGEGPLIQWGDRLAVHYEGRFFDGTVFDSSYDRGKPLEFYVGNMVPGWNEGLQLLTVGSKAVFVVPAHLGYGAKGLRGRNGDFLVPPQTNLIFRIEVLEMMKALDNNEKTDNPG